MRAATVVVPVYNQLDCTRLCLESVFRHTNVPFELVVVDNGSRDGTTAFLAGLRPVAPCLERWQVVRNPVNAGVARAWNQGISATAPDRPVCFLNNDVLVTPGWQGAVLGYLEEHPESGIVSPHVLDGEPPAGYLEAAAVHAAAHRNHTDEGFHGCCFVVSPAVRERVGRFDERFQVGTWEDVDYCHRARLAGFRPRVTHRAVVHHLGSRTMSAVAAELGGRDLNLENLRRFTEKWGIRLGNFRVSHSTLLTW